MRAVYIILCLLLLAACRNQPPISEVQDTPEALKHLPPGTVIDLGDGYRSTVISQDKILHERPAQPVIRKCKNCGNTYTKDKSDNSDHSKTKDRSDTTQKNKQDQSLAKDSRTDNRVQQPGTGTRAGGFFSGMWYQVKVLLMLLGGAAVLYFLLRLIVFRRLFIITLIAASVSLASCNASKNCPTYNGRRNQPLYKPTFLKDHGHKKNKYSDAAKRAADQTDEALYLSVLQITPLAE